MREKEKAVLVVNVGTPDKDDIPSVRRFLLHFLNDKRIIDIPWFFRKILVNLIIVPFRAHKSTRLYHQLWTPEGSPLLLNMKKFANRLQNELGPVYHVYPAMRYGNPSLKGALKKIKKERYEEIIVFPLFPQYASSTSGTILDFVMAEVKRWQVIPALHFVPQFYYHPGFLESFAQNISSCHPEDFDHIIFSYHGLPLRQVNKVHPGISFDNCSCEKQMPPHGKFCYKATCYETTRLLAEKLGLESQNYSVTFQSRFSKNWLSPFTDERIRELALKGNKKILVVVPSFVADCLESLVEIEIENSKLFRKNGGEKLVLVKSLNDNETWVKAAADMVRSQSA